MMTHTTFYAALTVAMIACASAEASQDKAGISGPGTVDKDKIRDVVRAHIDEVRFCYNEALALDPTIKAKFVVDFTIGAEGKVTKSAINKGASNGPAEMGECVRQRFAAWQYPAPTGGSVQVSYPMLFEPG